MDLGHKKFAVISGQLKNNDRASNRLKGVRYALESRGLSLSDDHVVERSFGVESGRDAFNDYKKQDIPNMAIFGCNDHTCFGFMKEALEAGYKIPKDFGKKK